MNKNGRVFLCSRDFIETADNDPNVLKTIVTGVSRMTLKPNGNLQRDSKSGSTKTNESELVRSS